MWAISHYFTYLPTRPKETKQPSPALYIQYFSYYYPETKYPSAQSNQMATPETCTLGPAHAPKEASVATFASLLPEVKRKLVTMRHKHTSKHTYIPPPPHGHNSLLIITITLLCLQFTVIPQLLTCPMGIWYPSMQAPWRK